MKLDEINELVTLEDLKGKTEMALYWSRAPGRFVDKWNGTAVISSTLATGPEFSGTVREWYETLHETIMNICLQLRYEKEEEDDNLLGLMEPVDFEVEGKIITSPDILTMLEQTCLYRSNYRSYTHRTTKTGSERIVDGDKYLHGTLSNRINVYKSSKIRRNEIIYVSNDGRVGSLTVLDLNII